MRPTHFVLAALACGLVASAWWLWSGRAESTTARGGDPAAQQDARATDADPKALDLAVGPSRATAAQAGAPEPSEAQAAEREPGDARSATPDYERVGQALPPRTIEGIVMRGTKPVEGGIAWRRPLPSGAHGDCKSDGPFAGDTQTAIGPDGVFRFEGVEPGAYCVAVEVDPGVRRAIARQVHEKRAMHRMVFRLGAGAIRGRVFDRAGAPVANEIVSVHSAQPDMGGNVIATSVLTSADGNYRVADLMAGSYAVGVDLANADPSGALVELGVDEVRTLDFGSPRGLGAWTGHVLAPDGTPFVVPWNVRVTEPTSGAVQSFASDDTGAFRMDLTPGRYALSAQSVGGWRAFDELEMPAHDLVRDVTLPTAWVIVRMRIGEGSVKGAASRFPFVFLAPRGEPARVVMAVPGGDSGYHFVGVPPGEYDAWLGGAVRTVEQKEPPKASVTVKDGDRRVDVVIDVPPS